MCTADSLTSYVSCRLLNPFDVLSSVLREQRVPSVNPHAKGVCVTQIVLVCKSKIFLLFVLCISKNTDVHKNELLDVEPIFRVWMKMNELKNATPDITIKNKLRPRDHYYFADPVVDVSGVLRMEIRSLIFFFNTVRDKHDTQLSAWKVVCGRCGWVIWIFSRTNNDFLLLIDTFCECALSPNELDMFKIFQWHSP